MTDTDAKAKKASIMSLMHGFPSSQDRITAEVLASYMLSVAEVSADAVTRSCGQFLAGKVDGHNNSFMPTAAELSANARAWDEAIASITASRELAKLGRVVPYRIGAEPPPPLEPLGPTKLEIDGRIRDVSHLTFAEKEEVMRTGKLPDPKTPTPIEALRPKMKRI